MKGKRRGHVLGGVVMVACAVAVLTLTTVATAATSEGYTTKQVAVSDQADGDYVEVEGCSLRTDKVGAPDLPIQVYRVVVPIDDDVAGLELLRADFEPLDGVYQIAPVNPATPTDGSQEPETAAPNAAIYDSDDPYPADPVEIVGDGYMLGYHVITLHIAPVRYRPASGKLEVLTNLEFDFDAAKFTPDVALPVRRSEVSAWLAQKAIADLVENDANVAADGPKAKTDAVSGIDQEPEPWPTPQGPPVDFVIITSDELANAFHPLKTWKHAKGWITVIKTTSEINAQYPGVDLAERMRNFIIDAGANWGTLFFLLGGDTNQVPARFANWDSYGSSWGPTDLYFATAEGTWNANSNGQFGEPDDECDETPDFFVGRAPVEDVAEAEVFVEKVLTYELTPPFDFAEDALFMGASIGSGNDTWGQSGAENIINNYLPAYFDYWRLYNILSNGDELLTATSALAHLNIGYNFNYHADHCGPTAMGMGYKHGGGLIYNSSVDALTNGDRAGVLITLGCSPNAFDYDSISEHFINNPNGGLVAYMGNTRTGWSSQTPQAVAFYREVFQNGITLLGEAFSIARCELSYSSYYTRNMNLLGDPSMVLWRQNAPALVAEHPAALLTGPQDFTVRVLTPWQHPLEDALVCLYKENDIFSVGFTGPDGYVTMPVNCQTGGELLITATAEDYLPYQASIPAGPPIWGVITWPNGAPASHVNMSARSLSCQGTWTTMTDENGYYSFNVSADDYDVRAERRVHCTTYRRNTCPVDFDGDTPEEVNLTILPNVFWLACPYQACEEYEMQMASEESEPDIPQSNLFGYVYWDCGSPPEAAPYVTVTAKKVCGSEKYTTISSASGMYWFDLPAGHYNINASITVNGVTYSAQACNVYVGPYQSTWLDLTVTNNGWQKQCPACVKPPAEEMMAE